MVYVMFIWLTVILIKQVSYNLFFIYLAIVVIVAFLISFFIFMNLFFSFAAMIVVCLY